jgi:hypothetical protein
VLGHFLNPVIVARVVHPLFCLQELKILEVEGAVEGGGGVLGHFLNSVIIAGDIYRLFLFARS